MTTRYQLTERFNKLEGGGAIVSSFERLSDESALVDFVDEVSRTIKEPARRRFAKSITLEKRIGEGEDAKFVRIQHWEQYNLDK